jgi:hypothetical protein
LTGFRPVLGEIVTGGDVRGIDRDRAAEALRDREVERTTARRDRSDIGRFRRTGWGARAMILVNLFKVKGIPAMFCSLTQCKPQSAATNSEHNRQLYFLRSRRMPGSKPVREFVLSSASFSPRELEIGSEGIRIGSTRVAREDLRRARAGRGRGHGRKRSSTRMPFNLESKRHEQKSRGFAGL